MSLVPRLKDYYGEQSEQWAEDLYYAALDRLVMLQLQTIGGSNRGTHLAKMLSILDSRKHVLRQSQHGDPVKDDDGKNVEMPYGAALYAQLFNMSLSEVGNSFQGPDIGGLAASDFVIQVTEHDLHNFKKICLAIRPAALKICEMHDLGGHPNFPLTTHLNL